MNKEIKNSASAAIECELNMIGDILSRLENAQSDEEMACYIESVATHCDNLGWYLREKLLSKIKG